jgi:hypothetical protein
MLKRSLNAMNMLSDISRLIRAICREKVLTPQLVFIVAQQPPLSAPPMIKPSFGCFGTERGAAHRHQ